MDALLPVTGFSRGRPSKEATAQLELRARAQEAGLLASALRIVVRQLEAVLLSPVSEVPMEAFALTAQIRSIGDRYERRWDAQEVNR